jgi:cathepsin A (carboxypeptidase C)
MRLLSATLLAGAASAATPSFQQVLGGHKEFAENVAKQGTDAFSKLSEQFKSLSGEARQLWEEVSASFPESMDSAPMLSLPKKHTRRPDSHWDYHVSGADVQSIWVEGTDGTKEREVDGKLDTYGLRAKKVDPSALGIDPGVKQYSGYLDDNENDKHLFYCELYDQFTKHNILTSRRVFRVS